MSGWGKDLRLYLRLMRQARPYSLHIAAIFLLQLLSSPLALLAPVPLKIVVDSVIGTHPPPRFLELVLGSSDPHPRAAVLLAAVGLLVAVTLLSQVQALASWLLETYTGEKLALGFRAELFRHVQRLSFSYHDVKGTSDSIYRIQYDAPAIQWAAIHVVIPFIGSGLTLAGMIAVTMRIDRQLALVALAVSPVIFLLTRVFSERLRAQWAAAKRAQSSALSVVQEVLTGLRVVKAFAQEEREEGRFVQHSVESLRANMRVTLAQGGFTLLVGLVLALGTGAALWIGVRHVQSGLLSLGDLLIVMAYLAQLYEPLRVLSKKVTDLQSSLASAERAFDLLDQAPDVAERPNARRLGRARGGLIFRDVSFGYQKDRPILRGLSFEIRSGSRVGISGTTGAGKTTLVSLLTRFYDPTAGTILLDGVSLDEYRLEDLRRQFALVLQEPVLFSTSIAENIVYARPQATEREMVAAAEAAGAHAFISALPEGYSTLVGERGMRLSGGERQRISLARAFLKDAPILILDEPTSSVDVKTEAAILGAMERLMRGRTTLMIAHRASTLRGCDTLLQIENGELVNGRSTS